MESCYVRFIHMARMNAGGESLRGMLRECLRRRCKHEGKVALRRFPGNEGKIALRRFPGNEGNSVTRAFGYSLLSLLSRYATIIFTLYSLAPQALELYKKATGFTLKNSERIRTEDLEIAFLPLSISLISPGETLRSSASSVPFIFRSLTKVRRIS